MQIELGNIYWLKTVGDIEHPNVVVSLPSADSALVCSITTNMRKAHLPGNIMLEPGEGGLEKPSIVEASKTFLVKHTELTRYVGQLNHKRVEEILNGVEQVARFLSLNRINPL